MIEIEPLVLLLSLGFTLGLLHALEGDHIAAVVAMSGTAKTHKRVPLLGLVWGLGHSAVLLLVGLVVLVLNITIPEGLSLTFEFLVGAILVVLGIDIIRRVRAVNPHIHVHEHGGKEHAHFHSHETAIDHQHTHKTFGFGVLHGLAGSGALVLLVLAEATSTLEGLAFIAVFGIGSIFGMSLVSIFLGALLKAFAANKKLYRMLQGSAGFASIIFGGVLIYSTTMHVLV